MELNKKSRKNLRFDLISILEIDHKVLRFTKGTYLLNNKIIQFEDEQLCKSENYAKGVGYLTDDVGWIPKGTRVYIKNNVLFFNHYRIKLKNKPKILTHANNI